MFEQLYYKSLWFLKDTSPLVVCATFVAVAGLLLLYLFFIKKQKTWWSLIYSVMLSGAFVLILMYTLMRDAAHTDVTESGISHSLRLLMKNDAETVIGFYFNILLFVPFSALLRLKKSSVFTVCTALLLSVCIESIQLCFSLGLFELADIFANVIGSALAVLLVYGIRYIYMYRQKKGWKMR